MLNGPVVKAAFALAIILMVMQNKRKGKENV